MSNTPAEELEDNATMQHTGKQINVSACIKNQSPFQNGHAVV